MMTTANLLKEKLWGAISAVASSILTATLTDELSGVNYEVTTEGGSTLLVAINEYGPVTKCIIILLVFVCLWGIISTIIPLALTAIKRVRFRNKKRLKRREIIAVYRKAIANTQLLVQEIKTEDAFPMSSLLYVESFSTTILMLHNVFCPGAVRLKKAVAPCFRTGETVFQIGRYISSYEYDGLLQVWELVLNHFAGYDIDELNEDCKKLREKISDLKQVTKSTN